MPQAQLVLHTAVSRRFVTRVVCCAPVYRAFVVQKFQDGLMILSPDAGFLQPNPTMLRVGGGT